MIDATPITAPRPSQTPLLSRPAPIGTLPASWVVLTPEIVLEALLGPQWESMLPEDKADELKGIKWVRFAVTVKDYENMSRNMADILRWIKESQWQLDRQYGTLESP